MRVTRITIDAELGIIELRTGPGGDGDYVLLPLEISPMMERYISLARPADVKLTPRKCDCVNAPEGDPDCKYCDSDPNSWTTTEGGWPAPEPGGEGEVVRPGPPGIAGIEYTIGPSDDPGINYIKANPITCVRGGIKYPTVSHLGNEPVKCIYCGLGHHSSYCEFDEPGEEAEIPITGPATAYHRHGAEHPKICPCGYCKNKGDDN